MTKRAGRDAKRPDAPSIGNPRARRRFEVVETAECGIVLAGPEVKSLREGRASIEEAYGRFKGSDLWLVGMHVDEYRAKGYARHEPARPRKLLLHREELTRLRREVERRGLTLVPLRVYFGARGFAKVELALARGRKLHDKREVDRERTAQREMQRAARRAR